MNDIRKFVLLVTMVVIGLLSLLGVWWSFVTPDAAALERPPVTVEVEKVRMGSIVQRIVVVGNLRADNEVVIHPEIDGKIKSLNFQEGQYVQRGDALVEIEDASYQAKVKESQALYDFAKLELDRYTRLTDQSAGSLKNKEKAQGDVLQAEARLDLAKLQLEHTIIRAPFAGYLGLKQFSAGALIDPRTELLTIVDVDPIKVDYRVPSRYLRSISKGQAVKVTIDSFPDEIFRANIEALDPKVDPTANSVLVRAYIPNSDGRLKPGLFARVDMVVGSKDNALLLPESSVLTSGDESSVFVVVDGTLGDKPVKASVKRQVVTGMSESGVIEIVRGLKEGDDVVSVGQTKVQDGMVVKIVDDAEAEAVASSSENAEENNNVTASNEDDNSDSTKE